MTQKQPNVLFLFSDEHDPRHKGVSGSPLAYTPNMDRLAAEVRDLSTPIHLHRSVCPPAPSYRITSRYRLLGQCHRLRRKGPRLGACDARPWARVESIGKLHYVNDTAPTGFSDQTLAMHIWKAWDKYGAVCDPLPDEPRNRVMLKNIGPGWSNYNQYDSDVVDGTVDWLKARLIHQTINRGTCLWGWWLHTFRSSLRKSTSTVIHFNAWSVPNCFPRTVMHVIPGFNAGRLCWRGAKLRWQPGTSKISHCRLSGAVYLY